VLDLIALNLAPAVVGCATAIRRFLAVGTGGASVNVSSQQAQRPVRGALPYATAKAAVEGLTRAVAYDYGPRGIPVNAAPWLDRHRALCGVPGRAGARSGGADPGGTASCTRSAGWDQRDDLLLLAFGERCLLARSAARRRSASPAQPPCR
jgi:NAD(P)-dependent dehydrogenase (short-subunit alcohol dehydrogenase family)